MSEITISTGHPDAGRIYAEALDRVTAERDAALGREAALRLEVGTLNEIFGMQEDKIDALQALLTAADERKDVLEGLLRRVIDSGQLLSASSVGEALEEDIESALRGVMQGE